MSEFQKLDSKTGIPRSKIIRVRENSLECQIVANPNPRPLDHVIRGNESLFKIWLTLFSQDVMKLNYLGYDDFTFKDHQKLAEKLIDEEKMRMSKSF
jgi:hypothetical protein